MILAYNPNKPKVTGNFFSYSELDSNLRSLPVTWVRWWFLPGTPGLNPGHVRKLPVTWELGGGFLWVLRFPSLLTTG